MTDKPAESALERYENRRLMDGARQPKDWVWRPDADAAIAELKAEADAMRDELLDEAERLTTQLTGVLCSYSGTLVSLMETVSEASLFVDKLLASLSDRKEASE